MAKIIRLTESDLARIVRRVLNEQSEDPGIDGLKIKSLIITDGDGDASSIVLTDGQTFVKGMGNIRFEIGQYCKPGKYNSQTIPKGCGVSIHSGRLGDRKYYCDAQGCKFEAIEIVD